MTLREKARARGGSEASLAVSLGGGVGMDAFVLVGWGRGGAGGVIEKRLSGL